MRPPTRSRPSARRSRREGWGAQVLAAQGADGTWSGGAYFPEWTSTTAALSAPAPLRPRPGRGRRSRRALGARPRQRQVGVRQTCPTSTARSSRASTARPSRSARTSAQDVQGIVDRLLTEQMADGGWNCEQERGSTRGSFDTTINVLEGLLEYERAAGGNADVAAARERGQEYLLERRLLRRLSTARSASRRWLYSAFPNGWHYDVAARPRLPAGCRRRRRTSEWPRRSSSSSRSATRMAAGRSS